MLDEKNEKTLATLLERVACHLSDPTWGGYLEKDSNVLSEGVKCQIENQGVAWTYFRDLNISDIEHYRIHKSLPMHVIFPMLERIGFGAQYHHVDVSSIPELGLVDEYISGLVGGDLRGVTLMGGFGVGKTTAMCYIIRQFILKQYRHRPDDFRFLPITELRKINEQWKWEELSEVEEVRFLIIDDLGRALDHMKRDSNIEALFAYRHDRLLPTFFTTNLSGNALRDQNEWLADRLASERWMHKPIIFEGKSRRGSL